MLKVQVFGGLIALLLSSPATAQEKDKREDKRGGTVVGVVVQKEARWIDVKADGEEKPRRYASKAGDAKILEAIQKVKVGSRVKIEWEFLERPRVVKLDVLKAPPEEKPEKRGGTVVGVVVRKEKGGIEVKADGEEKARRYVPHWVGGAPAASGGYEKRTVEAINKVKVGSRVKLEWEFDERPRVIKLDVLKESQPEEKDK